VSHLFEFISGHNTQVNWLVCVHELTCTRLPQNNLQECYSAELTSPRREICDAWSVCRQHLYNQ